MARKCSDTFSSCHFAPVTSGLQNFALAQHCFIKSIEVEQNVCNPYLLGDRLYSKHYFSSDTPFLMYGVFLNIHIVTECGSLDQPWYPVFEEGKYRGGSSIFFTVLFFCSYN